MASMFDYQSAVIPNALTTALQKYLPQVPNPSNMQFSNPEQTQFGELTGSPLLDKAALDGTNYFGSNSMDGAAPFQVPDVAGAVGAATPGIFSSLGNWLKDSGALSTRNADGTTTMGWGGLALGAAQGLGSAFMGMKQYGLAKEALANSKAQFERQYAAQRDLTNSRLEDRQRARVASNSGAYQSVGDYMNKYGVK